MDKRMIVRKVGWIIWVLLNFAVALFICKGICGCSVSRKSASQSYLSVDSVSAESSEYSVSVSDVSAQSSSYVSFVADSVKVFPLRIAPESIEPPDSSKDVGYRPRPSAVLPAFAASLYGVRLDMSNDCSSSLALSDSHVSSEAASALSRDEASKESAESEAKSPSSIWGIIVFVFLILAVLMLMRYIDR